MEIIKTPWTEEQVDALKTYQVSGRMHPYTCINNGSSILVPTEDGWVCDCCDYTQDWAHKFSTEPQKDFPFPFLNNEPISYSSGTSGYTGNCPDCGKPYIYVGDVFGDLKNYICMCSSKVSPYTNAQGWQCPRCYSVYAPWVSQCHKCSSPFYGGYTVTSNTSDNT